ALDLIRAVRFLRSHELRKVARQSSRVARDIVNARGEDFLQMGERFRLHARAWRIDDTQVGRLLPARKKSLRCDVARRGRRATTLFQIGLEVLGSSQIRFHTNHTLELPGQRYGEQSNARK